jgi:hypothetical protein
VHSYLQSVLKRETNLTSPQTEALETAATESQSTIRLLQDLLDLARADVGYLHIHLESLVLNDLIVEVAAMAMQYSSNRIITLEAAYEQILVKADRSRLKQVLINLIDNAIKYPDSHLAIALVLDLKAESALIMSASAVWAFLYPNNI